jgi:hypothetical protein
MEIFLIKKFLEWKLHIVKKAQKLRAVVKWEMRGF